MPVMKRKYLLTILLGLLLLGTATLWFPGRGDLPPGCFRVTVQDVLKDKNALMAVVEIEARSTAYVHVIGDEPRRGGVGARMPDPKLPNPPWWETTWPLSLINRGGGSTVKAGDRPPTRVKLTILGDHVRHQSADLFDFQARLGQGGSWARTSETGPYPGEWPLGEVLSVVLASGTYREGVSEPLMVLNGQTFRLVVDPPKD